MHSKIMFIHGLEGSSGGYKAKLLRNLFVQISIPDFGGTLAQRMEHLSRLLGSSSGWILIGSSFGGLMAALYTCRYPQRVQKLIMLAPALVWPEFAQQPLAQVSVPTVIYHGIQDKVIPIAYVKELAQAVFINLEFNAVDDDHSLHKITSEIDWLSLVGI
jgi:pimeloyl-ACP methyl ester carboxylesterase